MGRSGPIGLPASTRMETVNELLPADSGKSAPWPAKTADAPKRAKDARCPGKRRVVFITTALRISGVPRPQLQKTGTNLRSGELLLGAFGNLRLRVAHVLDFDGGRPVHV